MANLEEVLSFIYKEDKFGDWGIQKDELKDKLLSLDKLDKVKLINSILEIYFNKRDSQAQHWIIKASPYFHIQKILDVFPKARFLHIIRDGRAVYNSKRKSRGVHGRLMETNIIKGALQWKLKLDIADSFPDAVKTLKYEELVADKDKVLVSVLDYLDVKQEQRTITKSQDDYFSVISNQQKHLHKNITDAPKKSISLQWLNEMSKSDRLLYEFLSAEKLKKYGYTLYFLDKGISIGTWIQILWLWLFYSITYVLLKTRNFFLQIFVRKVPLGELLNSKLAKRRL